MRSRRKALLFGLLALGAVLYIVSPVVFHPSIETPVDREVLLECQRKAREHSWLRTLSMAIQGYKLDNDGFLPYHEDGVEKALYLLKPYALPEYATSQPKGPEMFDAQNPDDDINGPAFFDDIAQKVGDADYDYINRKDLKALIRHQRGREPDREEASLIILAEKTGVRRNSKIYLTLSWEVGEHHFAPGEATQILGKAASRLSEERMPAKER